MHLKQITLGLLWLVLPLLAVASSSEPGGGPQVGDFAYPPSDWADKEPGTVLRSRKIDAAELGLFKIDVKAYQLLYRTSGRNSSEPSTTVTTVLVPSKHDGNHLVVAATPEDAAAYKCRPSRLLRASGLPEFDSFVARLELVINNVYLQKGYVVTVPDHEGPSSAFGVGPISGHAMLDAARATVHFKKSELSKNTKVVGVGYSGGANAAGWAAELQPSYAPELNAVGFTFGGTPTNLTKLINDVDGGPYAGLIAVGAAGVENGNPELKRIFKKYVTKTGRKAFNYARKNCAFLASVPFAFQKIQTSKYFKDGRKVSEIPVLKDVLDDLTMGKKKGRAPRAPVFMYHAVTDEVVPYSAAKTTAKRWCNRGANVEFLTETFISEHIVAYLGTFAKMVKFIEDRFAGKSFHGGSCKFSSVGAPYLDLLDDLELSRDLIEALKTLFGEATDKKLSHLLAKEQNKIGSF